MRDPGRIPIVLDMIERIWRRHPDWRLGQLVCNIALWAKDDVWDMEEDALVAQIERHIEQFDRRSQPVDTVPTDWLPGFFDQTAGTWSGPLVREDQGEYEVRESLE